jgi:hypothetical protein
MEAKDLIAGKYYKSDLPQFEGHFLLYNGSQRRHLTCCNGRDNHCAGQVVYCFYDHQTGLAHWLDPKDVKERTAQR